MKKYISLLFTTLILLSSCLLNNNSGEIDAGDDPNFTIVANTDTDFKKFNRKIVVFGIDIYAVPKVDDANLLHAANVMAQYLDNDEDSIPDNQAVLDKMIEEKAYMIMWNRQSELLWLTPPEERTGQDLGNAETQANFVSGGKIGRFDAALEEVLHIITHAGYSKVYPDVFGENAGSLIATAMDSARGDQFTSIPASYPDSAWYTYRDMSCGYSCQITEYTYWALTSILGAQENRLDDIDNEWKLNTKDKVEAGDKTVYDLLTNPKYKLPSVLPDGSYRH